jgi:uncharacterized protein (DUF983 family)
VRRRAAVFPARHQFCIHEFIFPVPLWSRFLLVTLFVLIMRVMLLSPIGVIHGVLSRISWWYVATDIVGSVPHPIVHS